MSTRTETNPLRYVARFVVEFRTPFLIGSGEGDPESDAAFVADANGLPSIPGSSLAGALRHAAGRHGMAPDRVKRLFGYQQGNEGRGSRLSFTWGHIHDCRDIPVEGRLAEKALLDDAILAHARHANIRDHVCIGHRGAVADRQKFDERCVPPGHRFTFEVMLEGGEVDREDWTMLLGLLYSSELRLGGKSRRGYGAYRVVSLKKGEFNLAGGDLQALRDHPVRLDQPAPHLHEEDVDKLRAATAAGTVTAEMKLEPENFWLIGGRDDAAVDLVPLAESRVVWTDAGGAIGSDEILVPGTALKGPLAHRTAYHYNALNGIYADDLPPEELKEHTGGENRAVREMFGWSKGEGEKAEGRRGRVLIDDLYLGAPGVTKVLNHVSIDRFTGGALPGALFTEKALFQSGGFDFAVHIMDAQGVAAASRKAFLCALEDLAEGRLSVGAGGARGNGTFRRCGDIRWSDNGVWAGGAK
jgi:CRISPR/Cas system CSM-associated protein Csm3 (group 7 of RAMP superfamily)